MADWPPEALLEWWNAHRRFRRTRSYGEWFGERMQVWRDAADLHDDDDGPRNEVHWRGRIALDERHFVYVVTGAAHVDLIQADKSGAGPPKNHTLPPGGNFPACGGPPRAPRVSPSPTMKPPAFPAVRDPLAIPGDGRA